MKLLTVLLVAAYWIPLHGVASEVTVEEAKQLDMVLRYDHLTSHSEDNTVVTTGEVQPLWSQCKGEDCNIRTFSEYTEQLFFELSYEDVKQFSFGNASIKTIGGRAAAEIVDYSHDVDERTGEIIVFHNCAAGKGDNRSLVEMSVPLTSSSVLEIGWVKYCGSGKHDKLDYGIVPRGLGEGMVSLRESDDITMGPGVLSTRVYLRHLEEGYSQRFSRPSIKVTGISREGRGTRSNGVGIEMKGSGFGDMVLGRDLSTLDIFYSCREWGLWNVSVSIEIPPFESVKMYWMKDCGGGREESISIGTRDGIYDVVKDGNTMEGFSSHVRGRGNGMVTGKDSGTKAFFMSVKTGDKQIGSVSIGEITATSENERIGRVSIAGINKIYERSPWGVSGISEQGEVISGSAKRMVGITVKCLKKGLLKVSVRISIHDRNGVEWWFFNECPSRKRGWYLTAGTITYVMMCLICGMMVLSFGTKRAKRMDQ